MTDADPQSRVQAEIREDAASTDGDDVTRREALENQCREEGEPPGGYDIGQPIE